MVDWLTGW